MHILMVHPHDLYSPLEPWTIRIKKLAFEFIERGHSVTLVYFPLHHRDANRKFMEGALEVIALDRRLGASVLLRNILRMITLAARADIIHFQKCYYYAALPALVASWVQNKPVHYDWDDWETRIFYYSNQKQKIVGEFLNIFERLLPKVVDSVSVASARLHGLALQRGVSPDNIFAAPVGADLDAFNPHAVDQYRGTIKREYGISQYLVLYVGQLHGGQYVELFIHTACHILNARRDVMFMIIGDGYRLEELRSLTKMLGVSGHFIFTGHVSHDEIPRYLADADVCVACFEDNDITRCKSPLKIVEYLACGNAIVASNVGEVRNMVGGVGVLVPPGDAPALANGTMLLLGDKKLRDALGKGAMQRSRIKYNWAATAKNLLKAYHVVARA